MPRPRSAPRSAGSCSCSPIPTGSAGRDGERIPALDVSEAERLIADGVIAGGMVPKVRAALRGLGASGASRAIIADGRASGAIGRALAGGTGTAIRGG